MIIFRKQLNLVEYVRDFTFLMGPYRNPAHDMGDLIDCDSGVITGQECGVMTATVATRIEAERIQVHTRYQLRSEQTIGLRIFQRKTDINRASHLICYRDAYKVLRFGEVHFFIDLTPYYEPPCARVEL